MNRTERSARLAFIRQGLNAYQEKLKALPEATCRICGLTVPAGMGTRLKAESWGDNVDKYARGLPANHDDWRRQHDHCASESAAVYKRLIGVSMTDVEAGLLAYRVGVPVAYRLSIAAKREPFDFVSDAERTTIRDTFELVKQETRPSQCIDGACGFCGISESIGWRESPLRWASDGTPAPLCSECVKVWDRASCPADPEELDKIGLRAFTGVNQFNHPAFGFRSFAAIAGEDHTGFSERWAYAPKALAAVRQAAWLAHPSAAPESEQAGIHAIRAERWAQTAAERSAQDEEQRRELDPLSGLDWS